MAAEAPPNYVEMVAKATELGFTKVTIIDRASYTCVGASAADAVADAYADPSDASVMINENVELFEWGSKDGKPKSKFWFYKKKFNILQRFEDGKALLCLAGKEIFIGFQFEKIWFLVYTEIAGASATADAAAEKKASTAKFGSAQGAYTAIWNKMWEEMAEDEAGDDEEEE